MVKKVDVIVETGKDLFSCFLSNDSSDIGIGLCGDGKTAQADIEDFYGIKVPQAKSLKRIRQGIAKIKGDLDAGLLIDKPVLQYV